MSDSPDAPPAAHAASFTPVPSRKPRHDGGTEKRQHQFVAALSLYGCVARSAKAVGLSAAAAWDAALDAARDRTFEIAVDRAVYGITVPRFYAGRFVGTTHRFDHRTIMAALMPRAAPPGHK